MSPKILRRQADIVLALVREIEAAVAAGRPADASLAQFYRRHAEYGSRDRRLFSEVVFSHFRWRGWLVPPLAPDPAAACVLAYLLDAADLHPAMALLAQGTPLRDAALTPLGALDLPDKAACLARATGAPAPSPLALVPAWVPGLLRVAPGDAPDAFISRALAAFQSPPPTWLRARPGQGPALCAALRAAGVEPSSAAPVADALAVPRGINLRALPPSLRGTMEVQDLASQLTGLICGPRPGERWWDACCGSGGKTLHLADLMGGRGSVLATDVRAATLDELDRRLRAAGAAGITARRWDGMTEALPGNAFDGILLDAPCSGIGTWHRNPDARWRLTRPDVDRLAGLQSALLARVARAVRPGGVLVYATCTLTQTENDGVIDRFLEATPGFAPAAFVNPLDGRPCAGRLWIYPWEASCNGMYVARLART